MFFLDWSTPIKNLPLILQGALVSMLVTIVAYLVALLVGTITGYLRFKKGNKIINFILSAYVELMRNTPVLVQIYFFYFGLAQIKVFLPSAVAGILALSLFSGAYLSEIIRGGIASVPKGQWEAGMSLNLSKKRIFIDIILPQALRNIFPALINQFTLTLYATSLLSAIDVGELMKVTYKLNSKTFRTFELYVFALVIYMIMASMSMFVLRIINRKFFPSLSSRGE
ncbi:MAG: amino acid ABC transporter permease [Lachnospiraceae bacterium]